MIIGKRVALIAGLIGTLALAGCSRSARSAADYLARGDRHFAEKDYTRAILEYKNAMQASPKEAEPYYRLGLALLESNDAKSGVAFLQKALQVNPKHQGAQTKLAELMAFSRNPDRVREAEQRVRQILSMWPDSTEGLRLLAITEWRLGRPDEAEKHLRSVLDRLPDHLQSAVGLAWMKLSRQQTGEAEQILKDVAARAPQSTAPLVALGRFYTVIKRWDDAEQQFRVVVSREPDNAEALVDLSRVLMEKGDHAGAERLFQKLADFPDRKYRPLHAVYLFQSGKQDAAVTELRRLFEKDRGDRAVRSLLVSAYLSQSKVKEAEQVLKEALERNGRDVEARLQRSRILLLTRRFNDAQADLLQVLHFEPNLAEAEYLMSKVHAARGETSLEREKLESAVKGDRMLLPARIDLSRRQIAAGDASAALETIRQTPPQQADLLATAIQKNWALLAMKNFAETRKGVDSALKAARLPELLLQDAVLRLEQRDFDRARATLEEGLKGAPEDPRILEALASSYAIQGKSEQALAALREHAARHPKSVAVQALAGRWMLRAGDYAGARQAYSTVKRLGSDRVAVELALADIDQAEGKLEDARARLAPLADSRDATSSLFFTLANIEGRLNRPEEAIRLYRKTLELDPRHTWALNNLAFLLADHAGKADEALTYAQQAVEASPDHPSTEDTLGWVYYHKGIYTSAITHLEGAVSKGGGPVARYHLGMAYAKAGKRAEAQRALRAALTAAPNFPYARHAREALAEAQ